MNMQDVYEIQNLLYSYCWLVDSGDFDGLCELLKDADILYSGKLAYHHDPKRYMQTLKPIIRYEDGTPKTAHICADPVIEIAEDGEHATARSYTIVCQGISGKMQPKIIWIDRKLDTFIKVGGKWRFNSRDFVTRAEGDTSNHMDMSVYAKGRKKK